jgi:uncharacterized protein YqgC (DUF456 family)
MELLAIMTVIFLWLLGLAGVIVPFFPGPTLVMASAWAYFVLAPHPYPWWVAAIATAIWAIGSLLDALASLLGAKVMGSSKWGLLGATIGLLAGLFFFPIGLVIGPLAGAFIAELLFARKGLLTSGKVGLGAGMGILIGKILQVLTIFAIIGWMLWAMIFWPGAPAPDRICCSWLFCKSAREGVFTGALRTKLPCHLRAVEQGYKLTLACQPARP